MPLQIQDTSYSGTAASLFISTALTGADTIQSGSIMVMDDIRKKFTIPTMEVEGEVIRERQATPTEGNDILVNGVPLEPQDMMVYMKFNPRDHEQGWLAEQLNPIILNRGLPVTFEAYLMSRIFQKVKKETEALIWRGDKSIELEVSRSLSRFDGIVKRLNAASDTVKIDTPVALTKANVIQKMQDVYAALPDALKFDMDTKIFVNYKTAGLYQEAQQAQTNKGVSIIEGAQWQLNGLKVVKCAGMPDNTIIAGVGTANSMSNFWMGINSTSDENSIELNKTENASELWFVKMLMKVDVNVAFPSQAVLYNFVA